MTDKVKKLYKASRNDKEFKSDVSNIDKDLHKIDWFWSDTQKTIYASIYFGWLVGKGRFNVDDFL